MKLQQLISNIKPLNGPIIDNIDVSGIAFHSQKVKKGDLFVCIKGFKTDGHRYLNDAINKGAIIAIVEDEQANLPIPQIVVENSRQALAMISQTFYDNPAEKLKMIGVTATNGKTTTTYMINNILENAKYRTGLIGTVKIKNGNDVIPSELTTPESLDLQHHLNAMVQNDVSHVTMEVSSSAIDLHRVEAISYDILTFNNLSLEHIDTHGTFENYFKTKSSLITNATEDAIVILNLDDQHSASLVNKTKGQVLTYGIEHTDGTIVCRDLDLSTGRGKFTVEIQEAFTVDNQTYDKQKFEIELGLPGLHSVYNSLVAIIVGLVNHVPISVIQKSLKEYRPVPRRFEFIYEEDFKIVDDHFANPGNINVTLGTLNQMLYNDLHLIYGIRGQRGPDINEKNAETIVNWAKKLGLTEIIATKSVSHTTSKDTVTDAEADAFMNVMKKANINVILYDELPKATENALGRAKNNDIILLAGCQGMDEAGEVIKTQIEKNKNA